MFVYPTNEIDHINGPNFMPPSASMTLSWNLTIVSIKRWNILSWQSIMYLDSRLLAEVIQAENVLAWLN